MMCRPPLPKGPETKPLTPHPVLRTARFYGRVTSAWFGDNDNLGVACRGGPGGSPRGPSVGRAAHHRAARDSAGV